MEEPGRTNDRTLVAQFRAGDRDAFAALYHAHFSAVYKFAFYMTADPVRAGEITQDVFVWLVHHPDGFDADRGELSAFLGGVARKLLQRQQRNDRRWLPLDNAAAPAIESQERGAFAEGLEREQDAQRLRKAIAALPARYREAIVLCDLESKSYQEAADTLGCAMGTVRSRLHRARDLLVRKFQRKKEGLKCQ